MQYLAVTFVCRLQSNGRFPPYKGSMLRGILGHSLHRAVCITRKTGCDQCMMVNTCCYPRLFTSSVAPQGSGTAPMLPPPFCLEPEPGEKCEYLAGETFAFTLKLFSYATDYLPHFIHAFTLAGQCGAGRGAEGGGGVFTLSDVLHDGVSIYDAHAERLLPCPPAELPLPCLCPVSMASDMTCRLLTPLRFKNVNRLATTLEFDSLIRLILRRIRSLAALDGQSFRLPPEEFVMLRELTAATTVSASDLRWRDWSRYSGRQKTIMQLGGLVGDIRYHGPVQAFAEYLRFAQLVHIGKQSSFGLGACAFAPLPTGAKA